MFMSLLKEIISSESTSKFLYHLNKLSSSNHLRRMKKMTWNYLPILHWPFQKLPVHMQPMKIGIFDNAHVINHFRFN